MTDERVKIFPSRYAKGYLDWLSEKRDWPVSRQLWWGHQIPIWSLACADQQALETSREKISTHAGAADGRLAFHVENADEEDGPAGILHVCIRDEDGALEEEIQSMGFVREEDVLDTWFSSALWPHSTLGWPEQTPELQYYYPTSTLITSRDIITLWVARMVLAGINNMGEVPFREVFIHPKILDGYGETMSKSKGNGVDPLDIIKKFGTDALRFGLAYLTTDTQDVRMPVQYECPLCNQLIDQTKKNRELPTILCSHCNGSFSTQWAKSDADKALPRGPVVSERFELARNFANKLWNASRFALMNLEDYSAGSVPTEALATEDRWILSRLATVTAEVTQQIESYHYADAVRSLYGFAWDEFCSFYIEMAKSQLDDPDKRATAQRVLAFVLDNLLRLLHPIIPFITEEIWSLLGQIAPQRGLQDPQLASESIMIAEWPTVHSAHRDAEIEQRFAHFQEVLGAVRKVRKSQNIAPKHPLEFHVQCDSDLASLLQPMEPYFERMANARCVQCGPDTAPPAANAQISLPGIEVMVDLKDHIDVDAEIARLDKELQRTQKAIQGKEKKLGNESFTQRAPADVVQRERDNLAQLQEQLASMQAALDKLRAG